MDFATARGKAVPRVPLRHGEGNKDHLTSFGGLAALSLDALSSVAYGPEAIVLVLALPVTPGHPEGLRRRLLRADRDRSDRQRGARLPPGAMLLGLSVLMINREHIAPRGGVA